MSQAQPVRHFDHALFFLVITLMGVGLVMVYSASSVTSMFQMDDGLYYLKKQLMWLVVAVLAMLAMSRIHYRSLETLAVPLMLLSLVLLVVILIPGVTREINGAKRWLILGPMRFQPSELAKLAIIIFLARSIANKQAVIGHPLRGILPDLLLVGITGFLVLKGPNLSTAATIGAVYVVMLFLGNLPLRHLAVMGACGITAVGVFIVNESYRFQRLLAFLDPWANARKSGYHIIQSLVAIGSGGVWGLGLGNSRQKFFILPERHTDFIFAIICEELGLLGGLFVILLFALLLWRGYKIASRSPDMFGFLLASGITSLIAVQLLVNLGVVLSLLPTTGIPLPFVSYGGSSVLFLGISVGILLNISRHGSGEFALMDGRRRTASVQLLDPALVERPTRRQRAR